MKKTIFSLLLLTFITLIIYCPNKVLADSIKNSTTENNLNYNEIKSNKKTWNNKLKGIPKMNLEKESSYIDFPVTLTELKESNPYVIEGEITDIKRTYGAKNTAVSKVIVNVTKIISGNDDLKDKDIIILFDGGLTNNKDLFYGMESKVKHSNSNIDVTSNKDIYVENPNNPLPKIGDKIITAIRSNQPNGLDPHYDHFLNANHLSGKDSYSIYAPEYNVWLKENKTSRYEINNKSIEKEEKTKYKFRSNQNKMEETDPVEEKLLTMTNEINKYFN